MIRLLWNHENEFKVNEYKLRWKVKAANFANCFQDG